MLSQRRDETSNVQRSKSSPARPLLLAGSNCEIAAQRLQFLLMQERAKDWAQSFRRKDPRFRLFKFFQDVAREGAKDVQQRGIRASAQFSPLVKSFHRASVFTIWRPTSPEAIRKLITGEAVGKGLDIKGKSAKGGALSGFVPFLQIHKEAHKCKINTLCKHSTVRLFYRVQSHRDLLVTRFSRVANEMTQAYHKALHTLSDDHLDGPTREEALQIVAKWEMINPTIDIINDYAEQETFGIELPERLFWETYVTRQDISKLRRGVEFDTRRSSQPEFQDMNFKSLRHRSSNPPRRIVLYQSNQDRPLCPFTLLMAYEEFGRVKPVVSDFDCLLVGTRGISYTEPLANDQQECLLGCVERIAQVLQVQDSRPWTVRWLEVLKDTWGKCKMTKPPEYGFGDPKSYAIVQNAVERLRSDGCMRHGSESFNYTFPQDLDEEFLVIDDVLPIGWKYIRVDRLQDILKEKIDQGFTFPLNPKWVLCDPGWKDIYDRLLASDKRYVPESTKIWFPPAVREKIEAVHRQHPYGFQVVGEEPPMLSLDRGFSGDSLTDEESDELKGAAAMDLVEEKLNRYQILRRVKFKLRIYVRMINAAKGKNHQQTNEEDETPFLNRHATELVKLVARSKRASILKTSSRDGSAATPGEELIRVTVGAKAPFSSSLPPMHIVEVAPIQEESFHEDCG